MGLDIIEEDSKEGEIQIRNNSIHWGKKGGAIGMQKAKSRQSG